jgi:site-specific recombinase XerD
VFGLPKRTEMRRELQDFRDCCRIERRLARSPARLPAWRRRAPSSRARTVAARKRFFRFLLRKHVTAHTLRHVFAFELLRAGANRQIKPPSATREPRRTSCEAPSSGVSPLRDRR